MATRFSLVPRVTRRLYAFLFLNLFAAGVPRALAQASTTSLWLFGKESGVDFRAGRPDTLPLTGFDPPESPAVMSDSLGNLLFYTDGYSVWNREHALMPHGIDPPPLESSAQPALVVPQPGSKTRYYIFTTDAQAGEANYNACGCVASVLVDMTADRGRGDVITRPRFLHGPTTEKLAAVSHANGKDYWILTHDWGTNAFRAFQLTATGINLADSVVSRVGRAHNTDPARNPAPAANAVGQMAFSADGRRVAVAVYATSFAEVFDFDRATGRVSRPGFLPLPVPGAGGASGAYGVAFSPNGERLYISRYFSDSFTSDLTQYDLRGPRERVAASAVRLPGIGTGLLPGPDGRLYGIGPTDDALSVVAQPNAAGALAEVLRGAVRLTKGATGRLGLPNFAVRLAPLPPIPPGPAPGPLALVLPNIVTPNDDGFNDAFTPITAPESLTGELRIYSRWGHLVFQTTDLTTGWAAPGAAGTYYYDLRYDTPDTPDANRLSGWVEVVR